MVSISSTDAGEIAKSGAKWVESQTFNNVLLLSILSFMGSITWYALAYAVPKYLDAIQSGYQKTAEAHKDSIEKVVTSFNDERERQNKLIQELIQQRNR